MAQSRPFMKRLLPMAAARAAPGLAVVAALALAGVIAFPWAALAALACAVLAVLSAAPAARDLTRLAAYGEALAGGERSGEETAAPPRFRGWAPAVELASAMRRIARESERRRRRQHDSMMASQMVFDALPQPLLLLDAERRVVLVNRQARELIGTDPSGGDLAAAFRDPRVLEAADAVLAGGKSRTVSLTVLAPVERFFSVEIVPFAHAGADGGSALMALYDLTERKRAEQMRADFIANASHELRTPLSTLIGFIETLRGPARGDMEAQDRFLGLMHDQATRMARLVQDLLSLSAIELAEHAAPGTPVDVPDIVAGVVAMLQLEARKKGMAIKVETAARVPPVPGDKDQLAQLFQNLVDNAIKYGRKESEITVTIAHEAEAPAELARPAGGRARRGAVRVTVADQGEGIAAAHIPRLTERFYRVDTARSRAVGGTGLGLAIVKHIVNRHRGLLAIESAPGVGSRFTVTLPEAAEPQNPKDSKDSARSR